MKIGFALLTHTDYDNPLARHLVGQAVSGLQKAGVELVVSAPLTSQDGAVEASLSFLGQDVDGVILFLASWMECPVPMTLVQELGHLPLLLWGTPMVLVDGIKQSTGSYVSFAMFQGVLERLGQRANRLLGSPDDEQTLQQARSFCRTAAAIKRMKRSRVALVGYSAMGIYPGTFDHLMLRRHLGPEVVHLDTYSVIRRAEQLSDAAVNEQVGWLHETTSFAEAVTDQDIARAARLAAALQELTKELAVQAINVKCQPEFSKEYGAVACVPVSALADQGLVSSCEGDMLCTVSMLLLHLLSGQVAGYGDSINHQGQVLTLSACGFMPYSFADREDRLVCPFMEHPGFQGIQNSFVARPGEMTVIRFIEDIGSFRLLAFTGQALPTSALRQGIMPSVDLEVSGSMDRLVSCYNGQHYAFVYGNWMEELIRYGHLTGVDLITV